MLRITNIKLSLDEDENQLKNKVAKKLKIPEKSILNLRIHRKSIDARKKDDVHFVYTVDVELENEEKVFKKNSNKGVSQVKEINIKYEKIVQEKITRPIIVGTGPAGLFAGLALARMGFRPILFERGKRVDERVKDVEAFWKEGKLNTQSNVQFGEGGAGTFSDGKLNTSVNNPRGKVVLEEFVKAGAPEEILYSNKPHIGTDLLRNAVKNIRNTIISLGGEVKFNSQVTDLLIEDNRIIGVKVNNEEEYYSYKVILALGHSARDTFEMLYKRGVNIVPKPFSIGVRIEHPQIIINKSQYGKFAFHPKLGAADYKLAAHFDNGRSAYTFCMCPGGMVIAAASEENMVVTNGMSYHARDLENANSALLVGVNPEDFGSSHPLAGVEFQRKWERLAFILGGKNYKAPAQKVGDFLKDKPSDTIGNVKPTYSLGVTMTDLRGCLPKYVTDTLKMAILAFDKKIKGFAYEDAIMTGVETRSSSPIRIVRDESFQSNIKGLYPIGEGAGYAGGIMSAAIDGLRAAEEIAKSYKGK